MFSVQQKKTNLSQHLDDAYSDNIIAWKHLYDAYFDNIVAWNTNGIDIPFRLLMISTIFCISVGGRPKCGTNEEWAFLCGNGCESRCDDVEPTFCYKKCFPPQCQCKKDGDYRRNKAGKCVPFNECPEEKKKCQSKLKITVMKTMKKTSIDAESIEPEHEKQWLSNKIFLHAFEKEMVKKCRDASINNKKLITILRKIYEKEARLYPLSMQSLSMTGSFVLPKAIFIPPSQVVTLVAEYDADMTIEELSRKLIKSGKIKEQKRRIRYADNLLLKAAIQRRAMHMTNVLFELGKNVVTDNLSTVKEDTEKVLCSHVLLPVLECHLCHFKTESRIVLEAHKEIPHYVRHRYRCSFCTQSFINFHEITTHFSKRHGIIARKDYWNTTLECSSCAIMCSSEFSLKKHRKFCYYVKTGFTMFATRKQASCAINEDVWNATTSNNLLRQKFEYSILRKQANQKETDLFRKRDTQRWLQEDFSMDDFVKF